MNVTLVTEGSSKYRFIIPPLARERFIIEGRNYGMIWTKTRNKNFMCKSNLKLHMQISENVWAKHGGASPKQWSFTFENEIVGSILAA
jgi:hypothetical protein